MDCLSIEIESHMPNPEGMQILPEISSFSKIDFLISVKFVINQIFMQTEDGLPSLAPFIAFVY